MESGSRAGGHVFISYAHDDSAEVDWLERVLRDAGIRVWRDTSDLWPGEDWRMRIRDAITGDALVFIACFSKKSLARGKSFQIEELALAIEQLRVRPPEQPWLIPVRLDDCQIPDWEIGGRRTLNSIHRVDLFGDGLDNGLARLVDAIRRILGQPEADVAGAGSREPGSAMRYRKSESHAAGTRTASSDRSDVGPASRTGPDMPVLPHDMRLEHRVARFAGHRRAQVVAGSAILAIVAVISAMLTFGTGSGTEFVSFHNESWPGDCIQIDTPVRPLILGSGSCALFHKNASDELVYDKTGQCLYYDATGARDGQPDTYDLYVCNSTSDSDVWPVTGLGGT